MRLPLHEYVLALLGTVALALLIVRLLSSGLARVYKYFFAYLVVDFLQTVEPFVIPFKHINIYAYIFMALECVMACLYALIVLELYSVLLRDLKGIKKIAQRYTIGAVVFSIVVALLFRSILPPPTTLLRQLWYFETPVVVTLLLVILLIAAFLLYYPVPLYRNALIYSAGYVVYFLAKAALLFLHNMRTNDISRICSTAAMSISTACIVFWAIFLNRAGELRTMSVASSWSTVATQEQVLRRLNQLNDSLLRTRGK
jgi:hypothetical protein